LGIAACGDDGGDGAMGGGGAGAGAGTGTGTGTGGQGGQGGGLPAGCDVALTAGVDDEAAVQTALIEAEPGSTICFGAGTFSFTTELGLDVDGVTLRGAGQDQTILDFSGQDTGANGMLIRADAVTVEALAVHETPGDGIRADSVAGITFRSVTVQWGADESVENGAYGLYPVGSTDVVIDGCVVKGARDAGIYVGQSVGILVANSEVYGNVAGIEIENSTDAIVRDNHAHDNTAGILVFNLPGLPVQDGKRANVFGNVIENNNLGNFAEPGTAVGKVSPGVGVLILASDDNEVHGNEIRGNVSAAVGMISYLQVLFGSTNDPAYDRYPQGNFVHDNTLTDNGTDPQGIVAGITSVRPIPDVIWDGCVDPTAIDDGHLVNCLGEAPSTYLNFNYCGDFPAESQDVTPVTCTYEPLAAE
ncbi:MAG TPA: parallel beta-helix domain-containing protein, partial [Candidatus Nanopelagicales bacterium]|nr:parallel beta-helix domain-containing protein [Candidatus Nanopelagicales bacterium]